MTQDMQDSAAGIDLARRAVLAVADGDGNEARRILNTAKTKGEAVWAAGYLLHRLRDATAALVGDNPLKIAGALRRDMQHAHQDAVLAQVELIVKDEAKRGGLHG